MISAQGGIFGWVSSADRLLEDSCRPYDQHIDHDHGVPPATLGARRLERVLRLRHQHPRQPAHAHRAAAVRLGFPDELVFGRILPAVGLMLFLSTSYYAWLAYDLVRRTGPRRRLRAALRARRRPHVHRGLRGDAADQAADRRSDQSVGSRAHLGVHPEPGAHPRRLHRSLGAPRHAARGAARHARGRVDHLHLDAAGARDAAHAGDRPRLLRDPARQLVRRRALLPRAARRARRAARGHGDRLGLDTSSA